MTMPKNGDRLMITKEQNLNPNILQTELHNNNVSHVVWLPDTETSFLYKIIDKDPKIDVIPICREGESMPIAAGLWIGGKKPIIMIQNTGMFESGDSIRGMCVDLKIPMVILVGYRGWKENKKFTDSAAKYTEPIIQAWGIKYFTIKNNSEIPLISKAFKEAYENNLPVICLIATEYE